MEERHALRGVEGTERSRDIAIMAGLAALAVIPFARALIAGVPVNFGDLTQFYFWQHYLVEGLKAGHLPLWNPHALAGGPFIANPQVQAFYPLNLLLLLGPLRVTITLSAIVHLWLAGMLQYCYLRSLWLRRLPSTLGAVCFMLGGHLVAGYYAQNITRNCALVWLPAMLWATHMAVTRRSLTWAVAGAGFLSLSIFAGFPQTTAYALILVFGQVILSQVLAERCTLAGLGRDWALTLLFVGLGAGITAVQALPSAELLKLSVRQSPSFEFASLGSLPPYQVLSFALPNVFGSPAYHNSVFGAMFWEACVYIGIVPLLLVLVPATSASTAIKRFFIFFLVLFGIVALGRYTPLWRLIFGHVPFANTFRFPSRALGMVQFLLSCSAAVGAASLAEWCVSTRDRLNWTARWFSLSASALVVGLVASLPLKERILSLCGRLIESRYTGAEVAEKLSKLPGLYDLQQQAMLAALLFVVGGVIVITACRRARLAVQPALVVLTALAVIDLLVFASPLMQPGDFHKHATAPGFSEALDPARDSYRILPMQEAVFERNSGPVNGFQNVHGYDPLILADFARLVARIDRTDVTAFTPNTADITDPDSRPVDLLNVKYVISTAPVKSSKLRLIRRDGARFVYLNPEAMPRVWLAEHASFAGGKSAALRSVARADFEPARTVVLETGQRDRLCNYGFEPTGASNGSGPAPAPFRGTCRVEHYSPERMRILVDATAPCYLVLSEIFCPGWEALVDGAPAQVLRANYAFRAVEVPAGLTRVEMRYAPRSLRNGILMTLCSLAVALCLLGAGVYRDRRVRRDEWPLP